MQVIKFLLPLFLMISGTAVASTPYKDDPSGTISIYNLSKNDYTITVEKHAVIIDPDPMDIPPHHATFVIVKAPYIAVGAILNIIDSNGQTVCSFCAGNPGYSPFQMNGSCKTEKWSVQQVTDSALTVVRNP